MQRILYALFLITSTTLLFPTCKGRQVEPDYPEESIVDTFEVKRQNQPRTSWWRKTPPHSTSFRKLFNDLNDRHLAIAKKNGIEPPESLEAAQKLGFWELAKIDSCEYYAVARQNRQL